MGRAHSSAVSTLAKPDKKLRRCYPQPRRKKVQGPSKSWGKTRLTTHFAWSVHLIQFIHNHQEKNLILWNVIRDPRLLTFTDTWWKAMTILHGRRQNIPEMQKIFLRQLSQIISGSQSRQSDTWESSTTWMTTSRDSGQLKQMRKNFKY